MIRPDGITESQRAASLPPPARIPQRENVFSAGMFPRVSHFPRASQRSPEEWLVPTEWQKLERRPLPRAASVIVAEAWVVRRHEATVDLATRVGGTRAARTSGRAERFGLRDARNFSLGVYVGRH